MADKPMTKEQSELRDRFAAAALTGLVAYPGRQGESNGPEHFATWAYFLADAMMLERAKSRP